MTEGGIGFIVDAFVRTRSGKTRLYFAGRLESGQTFAAVMTEIHPGLHVRHSDRGRAQGVCPAAVLRETTLLTIDGEPCVYLGFDNLEVRDATAAELATRGVRTYEADLRLQDVYRLDRNIHGSVELKGDWIPGKRVDRVYRNPEMTPAQWHPRLSIVSLDLETDPYSKEIWAAAVAYRGHDGETRDSQVAYTGPALPGVVAVHDEFALLQWIRARILDLDPDIVTGWNVIGFDMAVLFERFRQNKITPDLGRSEDTAVYLSGDRGMNNHVLIPGRQVWDGARIVRAAPDRYPDYTLETVSRAVLGEGKAIEAGPGESSLRAILRLRAEDPLAFCRYCRRDAELVIEILESTGLFDLTLRRCELMGVASDRVWTSILAFEHLYIEGMHSRGRLAPSKGVDVLPMTGAAGGAILTPHAGLHKDVIVLDFRSLYPSIIRTFNIDPLSYVPNPVSDSDLVHAPNGACFRRGRAILPELLDRFFDSRAQAQETGDSVASYVYKIIMNSFYGVLGAQGCRFAGSDLAGAITSFGQHLLGWCQKKIEARGLRVLYGDTDSLFVTAGARDADGEELCRQINDDLTHYCLRHYGVESRLELEFEKHYTHFFLPKVRGGDTDRGRAKGYAGRLSHPDGTHSIEVRGMEAVRTDWTELAKGFQLKLLEFLFDDAPVQAFVDHTKLVVTQLINGHSDDKLVYKRRLRKPIGAYTASRPPHVKAAELLDPEDRQGVIRYVITGQGAQPLGRVTSALDYQHYIQRQLVPIASAFLDVLDLTEAQLFNKDDQLWLF